MEKTTMMMKGTGTIKRVFVDKGFGFIRDTDGTDRFFHRSDVDVRSGAFADLHEGQRVLFSRDDDSPKGPRAADVHAA